MNDIRNLMRTVRGDVEYREFPAAAPEPVAPPPASWALLERLEQAVSATEGEGPGVVPPKAPAPAPAPEPVLASQLRAAAAARAGRGLGAGGLSLGQYGASAPKPASAERQRGLPLADVFAILERAAR